MTPWLGILGLLACARPLPEHLRVEAPKPRTGPVSAVAPVTDRATALAAVIGGDPLARRPALRDPTALDAIPDAAPIRAFVDTLRRIDTLSEVDAPLVALEAQHPGTEVVGLARGVRLSRSLAALRSSLVDGVTAERAALALSTPVAPPTPESSGPLSPLAWAGGPDPLQGHAERRVLAGWLAGPTVPLGPVSAALDGATFDRLRVQPLGELIVARAEGRRADPTAAFADLRRATHLAVVRAAADRDSEQGAWADLKRETAAELGGVKDPIAALLDRAFAGLLTDAGDDRSAGGALLAHTALRLVDRCRDAPCRGLDRTETLRLAASWHPEVRALADCWEVAFWDQTLATLAAGRDTGLFAATVVDLADALSGAGRPPDGAILTRPTADPTVWLVTGRALGEEGLIDWPGASVALGRHLREIAARAATSAAPEDRVLLERIAARAVP